MYLYDIVNNLSSGVYYAKDKVLCYVDNASKKRKIKCSEFEYQLLKCQDLNIIRRERKPKRFSFAFIVLLCLVSFVSYSVVDASILFVRGLSFDNYIRVKLMRQVITTDEIEEVRFRLINEIKADFPGIRLNETAISTVMSERIDHNFGAAYFTNLFGSNVILLYYDSIDYKAHEIIHHLSNSGIYVGWHNRFVSKGRAINEGMTEYLKVRYLPETNIVYREKFYVNALINIFGEERMVRSYFSGGINELEELLSTYSNDFDLIRVMDQDHLNYKQTERIEEYIIQIFLNYLQQNQSEIADLDSYVDTFIASMTRNHNFERRENLNNRITSGVLAINI